ncbi:MAG: rod shape-determining protein RodA [Campylobacterales bacterium]
MNRLDRRVQCHFDYLIPLLLLPVIVTSVWLVYEINPSLAYKQIGYIAVSFVLAGLLFLLPLRKLIWIAPILYWIDILLLISVKFFGISILGAKRWLEIPLIGLTIQPSEIMKPALILMLAYLIQKNPPPDEGYDLKEFLRIGSYILIPFILIVIEPDLGSATVILLLGFFVLFIMGVRWKIWATLAALFLLSSTLIYDNLRPYQQQRIKDFLSEKPSYHVQQSIITIGSGGLFGKEKEEATQTQLKFLPIATSDFIFAYHVERFGFWGAFLLLGIYFLLIIHLFTLSQKTRDDPLSTVLALSVGALFFIYVSVNVMMTIGLAPVVGIPLPMFSVGGSSFINFMILLTILENFIAFRYNF